MDDQSQLRKIRICILLFMLGMVLSGLTAFPLEAETAMLAEWSNGGPLLLQYWILKVEEGVKATNDAYPFMAYGTDWLAFAHLVIAMAFIGPLRNPGRNIWVLEFGMISCLMILPLAFICGPIRGIPFYWQLIDCSFGLFGIVPLYIAYRLTKKLDSYKKYAFVQ